MARRTKSNPLADQILEPQETSVLDLLDRLLNKGVVLTGHITMGVAGVDLIYLQLSTIFAAADRIFPVEPGRRRRRHLPRTLSHRLGR